MAELWPDHKAGADHGGLHGVADDLVFPNRDGEIMIGYRKSWLRIAKLGYLPDDITPHVLRPSFASLAGDLGCSEATIATLIGHVDHSITSRYVHTADAVLLAAVDAVADKTAKLLEPPIPTRRRINRNLGCRRISFDTARRCGTN